MADFTVKMEGLGEILDKLKVLPDRIQRNVVTGGVRAGARVIANDAKQRAQAFDDPSTPNSIAKNIAVRSDRRLGRRHQGVAAKVGVLGGASKPAGDAFKTGSVNPGGSTFYWRFLEFGTAKMAARPFMLPAMTSQAQAAFDRAAQYMTERWPKEIDKL